MLKAVLLAGCIFLGACATLHSMDSFEYQLQKAVSYRVVDGRDLTGDLYLPERPGLRPAMVVVHGGGWSNRSGDMRGISEKLARAGFVVFNITYRLAPEYRFPTQVEDVSAALEWLHINAPRFDVDPEKIAGWGYSAGAHLILMAGLDRNDPPRLSSIVAGGTPADLTAWPSSPLVLKLIGKPMRDAAEVWRQASPVNRVTVSSPPVFLYHGQWDALVEPEQMQLMKQALEEQAVPVETHTVRFLGHVATYFLAAGAEQRGIDFAQRQIEN